MKQCVSCLKYYFTLSLPFEQRLVFRLRCEVQNLVSIIISISIFPEIFFLTSCHKWAVYADRANTRLRASVVRQFVPNELPCHTRHGALNIAVQSSLKAIDCFWQKHCDETLISSTDLGLTKKLHQLFLHYIFSYLSLFFFLVSPLSVVVHEDHVSRDVRFLDKPSKYENTNFPLAITSA